MAKTAIVYSSHGGSTKKYAEWIAEKADAQIFGLAEVENDTAKLSQFDTVVFGGGLYAGAINGKKIINKLIARLPYKKIIVYAVGMSPATDEATQKVRDENIISTRTDIKVFYLRGSFNYDKLSRLHKIMMSGMKLFLKTRGPDDEMAREILPAYEKPVDWTCIEAIEPILKELQ